MSAPIGIWETEKSKNMQKYYMNTENTLHIKNNEKRIQCDKGKNRIENERIQKYETLR